MFNEKLKHTKSEYCSTEYAQQLDLPRTATARFRPYTIAPDAATPGTNWLTEFAVVRDLEACIARAYALIGAHAVQTAYRASGDAVFQVVFDVASFAGTHVGRCTVTVFAAVVTHRFAFVMAVGFAGPAGAADLDFAVPRARL